jgi:serine/threonine protein kinase/tetratricopeptide (TPR) repeat protein
MKDFAPGLSDSMASMLADPGPCPHCDSSSQIAGGLCVRCLLEAGLDPDDGNAESLGELLAEVNLPDQNWRLGNYEVLEEVGRGGMGVIYRARQRHSRRIVAVKRVLSYHSDSRDTLARFRREAQAAASLDHPNILPIYEVSESEDGLPFFSMKFAPGGTLQQVAAALRNDPRQCVALVAKIARAVQYAHSRGILHRDLKPGNILIDGRGEPLVSDFGLAKWLDTATDLTCTFTIFGTPGYIAPEQTTCDAAELKPTADIYSLGAILFDLLAGRPPFLGAHALSVIRQASESPAPKLRTVIKLADRDLEIICNRCLEREPAARYSSAGDLAEDLERWLEGRPIKARSVSPLEKLWRWSRRNRKLAAAILMIVILASAGIVATTISSRLSTIIDNAELSRRSIAVIAFEDLDEGSPTTRSAQALTDVFIEDLRKTRGIKTSVPKVTETDPATADDWRRIGEVVGARFVLTGSIRHREGKPHVAMHLIESATGKITSTWLLDADSDLDLAKLSLPKILNQLGLRQTQIDERVITADGDPNAIGESINPVARSYYARGKELYLRYNVPDGLRAIESFQKAVEIDPSYGKAYAMLASACQDRARVNPEGEWQARADEALATALRVAPTLAESHFANALNLRMKGQLRSSIDAYLLAFELNPLDARAAAGIGNMNDFIGRPDLAIRWLQKAARREIRPLYADDLAEAWADLGEDAEAELAFHTAMVFRPDSPMAAMCLAKLSLFHGDFDEARRQCEAGRAKYKGDPALLIMEAVSEFFGRRFEHAEQLYREASATHRTGGVMFPGAVRFISALGYIQNLSPMRALQGRALLEEARTLDKRELSNAGENAWLWYDLAANNAALGDTDAAIESLGKATALGWIDYRSTMLDPRFDSLRGNQAFEDILAAIKNKMDTMRRNVLHLKSASTHD